MPELKVRKDFLLPPKLVEWFEAYSEEHEMTFTQAIEHAMREFKYAHAVEED